MNTNQPTAFFKGFKVSVSILFLASLFSCNIDPYKDVISLIPSDIKDKKQYLTESVNYFNEVNAALNANTDSLKKGRSISVEFANILHNEYKKQRCFPDDSIRAITFSYSKILQSLLKQEVIKFDAAEITILFGRYPKSLNSDILQNIGLDAEKYASDYAGKLTTILAYRTPGVDQKLKFFAYPPGEYDNVGQPCPPDCNHEPLQ